MFKRIDSTVKRSSPATMLVDGKPVAAYAGESVAVALAAAGILHLRNSPAQNDPRGAFCLMGVCQECKVHVDGRTVTACQEKVFDGIRINLGRTP